MVLLSLSPSTTAGAGEVEATTRATSARRTTQRLSVDLGAVRAVAVDARSADAHGFDGDGRTTFGLAGGPLVFGPVHPRGFLRLSSAPLGFVPSSSVYAEAGGLALDTGLEPTSRVGGGLELMRGTIALSVFEDDDARTGAVVLRLGAAPSRVGLEILGAASDVRERPPGDSWYPEDPVFAGRLLVHGGMRALLRPAEAAREAGNGSPQLKELDVTLLGSSGVFARPGAAASARAELSVPVGESATGGAAAVLGVEHPWYRNREGTRPGERAAARVSLSGSGEAVRVGLRGRTVTEDRPLEAGSVFPREHALGPAVGVGTDTGPHGEAAAERVWLRDADGDRRVDGEVRLELGYRREFLRSAVEVERQWEGAEYGDAVRVELALGGTDAPVGVRLEQWTRVRWPDGIAGGGIPESPGSGGAANGREGTEPPAAEGAAGISLRPGALTAALRVATERPIELSEAGRRALGEAPFDHLSVRLEVRLRVAVADLDAKDESGYLEVYGEPDNVDDGGHERTGHDGGVEPESMDDQRRDDTYDR